MRTNHNMHIMDHIAVKPFLKRHLYTRFILPNFFDIEEISRVAPSMVLESTAIERNCDYSRRPTVSFSSCQRNLIKTFQIEGMIALITKMTLIFSSHLLNGQK